MVAQAARLALISPLEYLRREAEAMSRHEYMAGVVCEMAGVSKSHTRLTRTLHGILYRELANGGCENLDQDVKVWIAATGSYYYPDATISYPPNFIDDANGVIDNPKVIVVVLSPSTRNIDRGTKFADYRTLASLRDYVLIDSEAQKVEVFSLEGGEWMVRTYTDGAAMLPSVGIELPLDELYRHVVF